VGNRAWQIGQLSEKSVIMFEPLARKPIAVRFGAAGVFVLESRHDGSFRMEDTAHDFLKVLLVLAGEGALVRGGRREALEPGVVAWVPAGCRHRIEDARPLSLYAVCVQAQVLAVLPASLREPGGARVYSHVTWAADVRGIFRQMLHEQTLRRAGGEALLLGLAWQLLGLVLRGASGRKAEAPAVAGLARTRVAAYVRELERTFFEERQIDGAAARLGLSRRRFTTLFREIAGDTWFNTVRAHRLAHARRLLRETGRSVTSICYECGFEDVSSFYRAFRTAERASPDAWRKRLAPDRPSQVPR
jgi:AraC family L-rhamnose operon regulatory protein RhaS